MKKRLVPLIAGIALSQLTIVEVAEAWGARYVDQTRSRNVQTQRWTYQAQRRSYYQAPRRRAQRAPRPNCPAGIASSTVYYVPHEKDFRTSQAFRAAVRMQGTGVMRNGNFLRYTGKVESSRGCSTARGARGTCLKPFISVAADPRYYRMGDIIEMPELKGRHIELPDGRMITHPGYFIVEDTGGAIKGPGRFDFFTGSYNPSNVHNDFGMKAQSGFSLSDKYRCTANKRFVHHRAGTRDATIALASIDRALSGRGQTQYASASSSMGTM